MAPVQFYLRSKKKTTQGLKFLWCSALPRVVVMVSSKPAHRFWARIYLFVIPTGPGKNQLFKRLDWLAYLMLLANFRQKSSFLEKRNLFWHFCSCCSLF